MSNITSLIKIEFGKFLSSFNTKSKKGNNNSIIYFAIVLLMIGISVACLYSFSFITMLKESEKDLSVSVALFAGLASMLIFVSSINQARGIYIGDDYDMLAALPIRKRDIVASKIIVFYAIEVTFSSIVLIPHAILLIAYGGELILGLMTILLAFFIPIVPIAIASLLSLALTMITARFRYGNFITIGLMLTYIIAVTVGGSLLGQVDKTQAGSIFSAMGDVIKWVNPSYAIFELSLTSSKLYLLLFIGVNLVTLVAIILLISLFFDRLHVLVSSIKMSKKYVRTDLKNKGETKLLLSLEFKRLLNSRLYFINGCMGAIMTIVSTILFLIPMQTSMKEIEPEQYYYVELLAFPIAITIITMVAGLASPSTCGISIEGKTFWIIKSSPVNLKKYLHVKLLFPMLLYIPSAIIASSLVLIFYHNDVMGIIMVYLIPVCYIILNTMIGLISNLHHIKLKWSNETEVVKNSAAVVIALFIDFGITLAIGTILIVFPLLVNPFLGYIIVLSLLVLAIIPCYLYLRKNFAKIINEYEDL